MDKLNNIEMTLRRYKMSHPKLNKKLQNNSKNI